MKNIKYLDKLFFADSARYMVYNGPDNQFTEFEGALELLMNLNKDGIKYLAICVFQQGDTVYDLEYLERMYEDAHNVKIALSALSKFRIIYLSPSLDKICAEKFYFLRNENNRLFDDTSTYDYDLMYNDELSIKTNIPYTVANIGNLSDRFPGDKIPSYKIKNKEFSNIKNPIIILQENLEWAKSKKTDVALPFECQIINEDGFVRNNWYHNCEYMPYAYLNEYTTRRPDMFGINRYKVYITANQSETLAPKYRTFCVYVDSESEDETRSILKDHSFGGDTKINSIEKLNPGIWL